MAAASSARVGISADYKPDRLFLLSCMALIAAAWVFSIRSGIIADLQTQFGLTGGEVGNSIGAAFLAFGIAALVGSPLCDSLGMGRLLGLAFVLHLVGAGTLLFCPELSKSMPAGQVIWGSQFIAGLAHGLVEAVINPLAATIYPDNKTHKLNVLHAWWPGGIVMGGLVSTFASSAGLGWQIRWALVLLPILAYGVLLIGQKFPPTERVAANVSNVDMFRECMRPSFIALLVAMLFTASLELGPGQWVDAMLTQTVGFQGILLQVYVAGLMFGFRFFAGALAHKFSPIGLMFLSSVGAGLGLYALSFANSPVLGLTAATIWGMGVCYMWPTMLGIAGERFPRGGALAMGLVGAVGSAIINYGLALIGGIYDYYTQVNLPTGEQLKDLLSKAATDPAAQIMLDAAHKAAAPMAFRWISLGALAPMLIFAIWWAYDNRRGGYKAEKLVQGEAPA